jgi:hypothetical protein
MRVIFSRKGFDASAGGCPSPIIDGRPLSLPIPYLSSTRSYRHFNLGRIVTDLSNGKLGESDFCHNDPDLQMGAFGQVSAAQSHLNNQNVGPGDLFLFFGWFREAEFVDDKYRYNRDAQEHHRIFGWMFIDQKITVGSETNQFSRNYPKYANHPHAIGQWASNNTIYIAPQSFSLFHKVLVKGFGRFRMSERTLLSSRIAPTKRFWNIPDWLDPAKGGCIPSYHGEKNYIDGLLKTAGRGQEFVCQPNPNNTFEEWMLNLFSDAATIPH